MKTCLTFTLALCLLFIFVTNLHAQSDKDFALEILPATSEQDVKDLQEDCKRRLITLEFETLKYNKAGKLRSIRGTITFSDGAYGSFYSERFKHLKITRTYSPNGKAGNIKVSIL